MMSNYCTALPLPLTTQSSSALLSQLLLQEILKTSCAHVHKTPLQSPLLPYGWIYPMGRLSKIYSYIEQLTPLLPKKQYQAKALRKLVLRLCELNDLHSWDQFHRQLQTLWSHLEPLIQLHKYNENLFLFLLKNQTQVDLLMDKPNYLYDFLVKIYPEELEVVGEKLCDQYHQRGFFAQISQCKLLLTQLLHARSVT